jgi:hypothetical protein
VTALAPSERVAPVTLDTNRLLSADSSVRSSPGQRAAVLHKSC